MGPSAIAIPAVAPQTPTAIARATRSVNTFEIRDRVAGKIIAAPTPMKDRAAISGPTEAVRPPATLAGPDTARPATRKPLRPRRSLRPPAANSRAADRRVYASRAPRGWR